MAFQKITESESLYDNLDQMSVRELLEGRAMVEKTTSFSAST